MSTSNPVRALRALQVLTALGWLLLTRVANACPVCHTGTGQQVRAGILDGNFGYNVLVAALPFVVFALVGWLIHGPSSRKSEEGA